MSNISKEEVIHMMKIQAKLISESFESLFEILELTPEQIDKFNRLCDDKMYARYDKDHPADIKDKESVNNDS
ncbi:hypothetical protein [Halarcobacter sp.]|uniref:hypothetical protein n=1 Tax=Halarcobacter sp. TaxID=2321133 RepID=UPI0029F4709F|nr:hypothetical protein [Halarcobacter sp.]